MNTDGMKKPKMLYILNVASRVNNFSHTSMLAAKELGIEFHIAGNWSYANNEELKADEEKYGIHIHQINFIRQPYDLRNYRAYKELMALLTTEKFDIIHCNTPIGGILGRICALKQGIEKVIYQAHGFHFYKGAPLFNWLIYYPVEKLFARFTDVLVTINQEDFEFSKTFKLRGKGNRIFVPGVGIDTSSFVADEETKSKKRTELGLKEDDIAVISMGNLDKGKNYKTAIRAIAEAQNEKLKFFILGKGPELANLEKLVEEYNLREQVYFLGFRNDVGELLSAADIFLITTVREGLSRAVMEAMASGLPCVVSRVRGNTDLMDDNGGYLCDCFDIKVLAQSLNTLAGNQELRNRMGQYNREKVKNFSVEIVTGHMKDVYITALGGKYEDTAFVAK